MTIETRDFGTMELDEQQFILFRSPIFGFEDLTRFALLNDDEAGTGLMWLQSVERAEICFIVLDPQELGLQYAPVFSADVLELLQMDQAPEVRVIAVVPEAFKNTTVNLKSPLVINPEKKVAAQVVLDADFPVRMRLFDAAEAK